MSCGLDRTSYGLASCRQGILSLVFIILFRIKILKALDVEESDLGPDVQTELDSVLPPPSFLKKDKKIGTGANKTKKKKNAVKLEEEAEAAAEEGKEDKKLDEKKTENARKTAKTKNVKDKPGEETGDGVATEGEIVEKKLLMVQTENVASDPFEKTSEMKVS